MVAKASRFPHDAAGGRGAREVGVARRCEAAAQSVVHAVVLCWRLLIQYKIMFDLGQLYTTGKRPRSAAELALALEAAILDGHLEAETKLPPIRAWADELDLSPVTVGNAIKLLRNRGLVATDGRRGTRVVGEPPDAGSIHLPLPPGVRDLRSANPDPALLPDLNSILHKLDVHQVLYGELSILVELAAEGVRRFTEEGVPAATDRFAVTSGGLDAIERGLRVRTRPGDRVAIEDPHFIRLIELVRMVGRVPEPVDVDDRGMRPDQLERALAAGARAVILSPRGQNPTGAAFDVQRAAALHELVAGHPEVLLIEDDHAADIAGPELHTITQGLPGPWLAIRSTSKSLGLDLRLAVLTGDALTVRRMQSSQIVGQGWVSHVLQRLVHALWTDPATARLLGRARATYATRRDALRDALAEHGIVVKPRSWTSVWLPVHDEAGTVDALREAGWGVAPGARMRERPQPAIRISMATLEPAEARELAAAIAKVVRPSPSRTLAA
jgi:DNA-binding transcriptional MocR family regulator